MSPSARKKGFDEDVLLGVHVDAMEVAAMVTLEVGIEVTLEVVAMVTLEFEFKVAEGVTILTFSGRPQSLMPCMSVMA